MLLENGTGDQANIELTKERAQGLGLFIRSVIGLARAAALEAFATYLDDSRFNADQIRLINLIIDELTTNGIVERARLYESPYTDHAPTGPDDVFEETEVDDIVAILHTVRANAALNVGVA